MCNICSRSYKIKFYEADFKEKINLHSILNYVQEISGVHAELLGCGYDQLEEDELFWVVSRMKVNMKRYPKWNEEITIETWPAGMDMMFFVRCFRIYDENKELIGEVDGAYLLLNRSSLFPQKMDKLPKPLNVLGYRGKEYKRLDKFRLNRLKDFDKTYIMDRQVRYNDLDLNMHVNNVKYVEWVEDCFSLEDFQKYNIKELQINFLKQVKFGEKVELYKYNNKEDNSCYIQGIKSGTNEEMFQCKVIFENI